MKFTVAYYLLLAYTFAILKPIVPLVQDTLGHFFWEAEHIATVHAHKGKNHVHQEVDNAHKATNSTENPALKNLEPVSQHLVLNCDYDFYYENQKDKSPAHYKQNLEKRYKNISYPPPKYLATLADLFPKFS